MRLGMNRLSNQVGQLVSILAHHWHSHSSGPVEVQMSQFVGQDLDPLGLPSGGVFDHIVRSRINCSLSDRLRNQVEVITFWKRDDVVKNGSTGWVDVVTLSRSSFLEEFAAKDV